MVCIFSKVEATSWPWRWLTSGRASFWTPIKPFYVEDSSVNMCYLGEPVQRLMEGMEPTLVWDRCLPGLLAFQSREAAEDFRREKNGVIRTYEQLREENL